MQTYKIYYQTQDTFLESMSSFGVSHITLKDINETHIYLKDIEANDLREVFRNMQGEIWSPNGEATEMLTSKKIHHTSMSVGDIIYDIEAETYYVVAPAGFTLLKETSIITLQDIKNAIDKLIKENVSLDTPVHLSIINNNTFKLRGTPLSEFTFTKCQDEDSTYLYLEININKEN